MFLESLERTYRNIPETRRSFTPLARLEDTGITFSNIDQVYGTHFTAAGMVAAHCGIPLLPSGFVNVQKQIHDKTTADHFQLDDFMSHVTCLGDILAEEGYIGSYMNGSDLRVFSKGELFASHGYERLFGVNSLKGPRAETYENVWGLNDETIFAYATEELKYLASLDRPFMMSMLTISTHGPDAELDQGCQFPVVAESQLPAAIHCSGNHVTKLLETLVDLGISEDTIVVVQSDHLAMSNTLKPLLEKRDGARRNFMTVLGAGEHRVISKYGSMIDVYPTILELMGYKIAEGRANMGVSLLNEQPPLITKLGQEKLHRAFKQNHSLAGFLWDSKAFQKTFSSPINRSTELPPPEIRH